MTTAIVLERGEYAIKTTKAERDARRWGELARLSAAIKKAAKKGD